jgi:hypothetical protein
MLLQFLDFNNAAQMVCAVGKVRLTAIIFACQAMLAIWQCKGGSC